MKKNHSSQIFRRTARSAEPNVGGFTLLEFLVAMTLFMIIAGATFSLFRQHEPYFNAQQNLAGTNIEMQNAVTQMQLDLTNAGTGYYPGSNMATWPVGISICPAGCTATGNQMPTAPCNNAATLTYGANCFDQLNILTMNPSVPPMHATDATGLATTGNCSQMTSTQFYVQPITPVGSQTMAQSAQATATLFHIGDQIFVMSAGNGSLINTFVLTQAPSYGANYVLFTHAATASNSTNTSLTNDPLAFTLVSTPKLGSQFCGQDWVMKLEPTTYEVDISTPTDPKLERIKNGVTDVIAEQVIGFKVGAATWNNAAATSSEYYMFNPTDTGFYNDFSLVRSVRISLIGRTNPSPDPTYTFRNTFDGGPYQVVGATVVVNPRNMSMND